MLHSAAVRSAASRRYIPFIKISDVVMLRNLLVLVTTLLASTSALAAEEVMEPLTTLGLTSSVVGYLAVAVFAVAYLLVVGEERLQMRKSKPMLLGAGLIWVLVGISSAQSGQQEFVKGAFNQNFLDFSELMLFLLVAMTYINAMDERRVFESLRSWMVSKGFSYLSLFWITGILAFFISPVADNLTTALLMCAVVMKVAEGQGKFIAMSCVNIVVAANAGGAFSPFGDITTLMVWQAGQVKFLEFFALFLPSAVNFLIPAFLMSFFLPKGKPISTEEAVRMKRGAPIVIALFLLTILTAVLGHNFLGFPPVFGMMTGLSYLMIFGYYLSITTPAVVAHKTKRAEAAGDTVEVQRLRNVKPFDIFTSVGRAEWDTLLFFYGVVLCVGGLGVLGYLELISGVLFEQWNPSWAAFAIGIISAVVDNIPVMFAVLSMNPEISHGHWLLVTLAAGVGGSLLSVGSAAGVALMGAARGYYTFMSHLRWMPVIFLGYVASMLLHILVNKHLFAVF